MTEPMKSKTIPVLPRLLLVAVLALLVVGCYRIDDDGSLYETPTETTYTTSGTTTAGDPSIELAAAVQPIPTDVAVPTESTDRSYTLSELLGYDYSDPEASVRYWDQLAQEHAQIVAECMRREGFAYVPYALTESNVVEYRATEFDVFSDEWVEEYGFGISTLRWSQHEVGADLVGYPGPSTSGGDLYEDPNDDITRDLSEAEREAWYDALNGPDRVFDPDADEPSPPMGCFGEAWDQVYAPANLVFDLFADELDEMFERAAADPRVLSFHHRVSTCIAEQGVDWDSSQDPWEHFDPQLRDIGSELGGWLTPEEIEAMSEEDVRAAVLATEELSEDERAVLADVQAEELVVAGAMQRCGGGQTDQIEALKPIYAEYERAFVEQNFDALATIRSS